MMPVLTAAVIAVVGQQEDRGRETSSESIYAQVEFEGGLPIAESDARLSRFAETLLTNPGITHIETAAKSGRGNVSVSFDRTVLKPAQVRRLLRETDAGGGFVYIGEEAAGERNWRITIFGADDRVCRELARKLAGASAAIPVVEEAVLHFKDGGPRRTLRPRREALSRLEVMFIQVADTVRRAVHAPVAYKRLSQTDSSGASETDVRRRTEISRLDNTAQTAPESLPPGADELMRLRTAAVNRKTGKLETPALESLVDVEDGVEIAGINREDRRRTASFGVRTQPVSAHTARDLILNGLPIAGMPAGYTAVFDREAIEAEEALRRSIFYFVLSLFFCYIVLAAAAESFTLPCLPLLATPPSLALPFLAMSAGGFPMNGAAVCAFIAVTGVTINAGVLSVDALKTAFKDRAGTRLEALFPPVYRALRGRLGALLATSATSASAALPFLFLREDSNTAVRMLAYVSAFGVTGSAFMSVTLIPALWILCCRRT
jgi:multidrug efflux pump subunit AcrB